MMNSKKLFTLLLMGIGVFLSVQGARSLYLANETVSWPFTEGKIIKSEVIPRGNGMTTYDTHVVYEYNVDGMKYFSDRIELVDDIGIRISDLILSEQTAYAFISHYPLGQKVKVFYRPKYPSLAILNPGKSDLMYRSIVMGIIIFCLGLISWKWEPKECA